MIDPICCQCSIVLDDTNWMPCRKNKNRRICSGCIRKDNTKRYRSNRDMYLASDKIKRITIKTDVFTYYGGQCQMCGETDFAKLSLDHLEGNGRQHRKQILGTDSGSQFYKWVLKNKPNNIRLLCYNCNCKVDMTKKELPLPTYDIGCKYCGGNRNRRTNRCSRCKQITKRNSYISLKLEVFAYYGSKCVGCGESRVECLTMDHINNDGAKHRKEIGTQIFPWLKKHNYPTDFQILCYNCNYAKRDRNY